MLSADSFHCRRALVGYSHRPTGPLFKCRAIFQGVVVWGPLDRGHGDQDFIGRDQCDMKSDIELSKADKLIT